MALDCLAAWSDLEARLRTVGNHREALACTARACGLYRRVQRQDIGLEGNVFDGVDDLPNILLAGIDVVHCLAELLHAVVTDLNLAGS